MFYFYAIVKYFLSRRKAFLYGDIPGKKGEGLPPSKGKVHAWTRDNRL